MLAILAAAALQAPAGIVAFRQACLDAGTDAVVLNVAAHPDDEAARTLVYLRRTLGVRTVALFTTCGEGGQNAVGRDIGQALAKRRVLETMAAAEHTGVEVRWLGFEDFGFSKTLEETLAVWGAERLENAMLEALRAVGPDLVLTNHDTAHGHGHHRASAYAIERAVVAYSREVGRDVPLYQRPEREAQPVSFALDVGLLDPVAGKTFARQAYEGLLEHASQGPWGTHDPARVRQDRWTLVWPEAMASAVLPFAGLASAFDDRDAVAAALGIDPAGVEALRQRLAALREDRPLADLLPAIASAHRTLAVLAGRTAADAAPRSVPARLRRRLAALERAWLHGNGVSVEAYCLRDRVPLFGHATIRVAVHAERPQQVDDLTVSYQGVADEPAAAGPIGELVRDLHFHLLPPGLGARSVDDPVTGARILQPTVAFTVAGIGVVVRPRVRVLPVPETEVAFDREVCVLPRTARDAARVVSLEIDYHGEDRPEAELQVTGPPGVTWAVRPQHLAVSEDRRNARALLRLVVPEPMRLPPDAELAARFGSAEARLPLRAIDVDVPAGLRIGLVRGPDDTLLRTLEDLGVSHTELDERTLAVADLSEFSTLVLDIRTAGHRPDLHDHRDRVLEFCARGGRVVAFYHKPREWNARPGRPALAPCELVIGDERVCEEDAPVELLDPRHRLLTTPHVITAADFADWQQERGLNFPSKWAADWTPLLRMADRGEKPQDGALLVARHGEGEFVYCSLSLYRQWRVGHAGALRLLVNLLANQNAAASVPTGHR